MPDLKKDLARREYLRGKKRESRLRALKARRRLDPAAPDQITLTLSTGAKAIIRHAAKREGISASQWVERLVLRQRGPVEAARRDLPGLFRG